jgi:hypothetical protein
LGAETFERSPLKIKSGGTVKIDYWKGELGSIVPKRYAGNAMTVAELSKKTSTKIGIVEEGAVPIPDDPLVLVASSIQSRCPPTAVARS